MVFELDLSVDSAVLSFFLLQEVPISVRCFDDLGVGLALDRVLFEELLDTVLARPGIRESGIRTSHAFVE